MPPQVDDTMTMLYPSVSACERPTGSVAGAAAIRSVSAFAVAAATIAFPFHSAASAECAQIEFVEEERSTQPNTDDGAESGGPAITVYSSADPGSFDPQQFIAQQRLGYDPAFAWQVPGFAVIKESRRVDLDEGSNVLRFTDVAQFIDPTTVTFTDLSDGPDATVLEQSFEFDLVSPSKLLERYIGETVTAVTSVGDEARTISGELLSHNQGRLVIRAQDGLHVVDATANLELESLPGDLVTKPTLVWRVVAPEAGPRPIRTSYQTDGVTWRADYNLILNADDTQADLGAWVTLMNLSGTGWTDAKLKLIAGDVQRIETMPYAGVRMRRDAMDLAEGVAAPGFEEKAFFEYHLYTLPRRTDILSNTTQQIVLFPTAEDVNVEKVLVYYGAAGHYGFFPDPQIDRHFGQTSNTKVDVYIRFDNEEENNLGIPLPAGKVRVYKLDDAGEGADAALEFVGEDLIDHTPRNEEILIKLGQAFDVVGERTQTDFSVDTRGRTMTESFEIRIRNQKEEAANVVVKENLYRWSNWEIVEASHEYEKTDARTIQFEVNVPAEEEAIITYTVRYSW